MKTLVPMFLIVFLIHSAWAQESRVTISGTVSDAQSRTPLSGATVTVKARELELICNDAGQFQFSVPRVH